VAAPRRPQWKAWGATAKYYFAVWPPGVLTGMIPRVTIMLQVYFAPQHTIAYSVTNKHQAGAPALGFCGLVFLLRGRSDG